MTTNNSPIASPSVAASTLMSALGFSPEDLKANQVGVLSDVQRALVHRSVAKMLQQSRNYGLFMFAVVIVITLWVGTFDALQVILFTGVVTIAFVVVWALFFVGYRRLLRLDMEAGIVQIVEGQAKLTNLSGRVVSYFIVVQKQTFHVERDVYRAFRPNAYYKLYYLPRSHRLLSAEIVEPGKV